MNRSEQAVSVFNKRAKHYENKYMDVSMYGHALNVFCNNLARPDAEILELACGPGNITKYILQRAPELAILATDLAPDMLAIAQEHNPTIQTQLLDCRNITSLTKKFDGIICGFALPYLSKEEAIQLIADAATVLIAGGVLYLSTMEGNYNSSGYQTSSLGDTVYVYNHEAAYLLQALEDNGFKLILQQSQPFGADPSVTDLLLVAVKQ
jgi:ubiquinone/menaquinone biosynthesis C-methylase UbiE